MELTDLYEGTESPALSEIIDLADNDRMLAGDDSGTSGAKLKWFSLSRMKTYLANTFRAKSAVVNQGNQSGNFSLDLSGGDIQKMTVTGNVTEFNYENAVIGQYYFHITIGGAGSWSLALRPNAWSYAGAAPTLTATAARVDMWHCFYDGLTMHIVSINQTVNTPS